MENEKAAPATFNLFGLHLPWKATVVVIANTLILMFDYYWSFYDVFQQGPGFGELVRAVSWEHLIIYFAVPMVIILLILRENPAKYGFTFGDWRQGIKWTLIGWAIAAPILFFAGRTPEMATYYDRFNQPVGQVMLTNAIELFGWEFFFRGFLMFALLEVCGPIGVVLAAVPFALAHIGKPALETLSTIFGGTAFGYVAWRGKSFLYAFLVHWFVLSFTVFVAVVLAK